MPTIVVEVVAARLVEAPRVALHVVHAIHERTNGLSLVHALGAVHALPVVHTIRTPNASSLSPSSKARRLEAIFSQPDPSSYLFCPPRPELKKSLTSPQKKSGACRPSLVTIGAEAPIKALTDGQTDRQIDVPTRFM